jgi:chromate transporter
MKTQGRTFRETFAMRNHHLNDPYDGVAKVSRLNLFAGFLTIGLFGFGGIAASIYHVIVERRRWLSAREYAAVLALGQVLPGANLINMSTIIGDRYQGFVGACLALTGLMTAPLVILVVLATLYDRFSNLPDLKAATIAASAGAVGLTVGTGMKLARTILASPLAMGIAAASFLAIGFLRLPMFSTLLILIPISVWLNWRASCQQ